MRNLQNKLKANLKTLRNVFLLWRYRNISSQNFIYILSVLVGFCSGIGAVTIKNSTYYIKLFLKNINAIFQDKMHFPLYYFYPFVGFILVYLIKKFIIRQEIGHGISMTLHAISRRSGIIKVSKMYASLITAPITVGFGGSVGLQGPAISTGAAIGSNIGRLFHLNQKRRMLLIGCATAGAVASMFKAPITAIIFALEVFSLDLTFGCMIPLLLACIASVLTSHFFLGSELLFSFKLQDSFQIQDTLYYVALGILTAIASVYFSKMYFYITEKFEKIQNVWMRILLGSSLICLLFYFIPPLSGEGYGLINALLHGEHLTLLANPIFKDTTNIWWIIFLLLGIVFFKAVAMTLTFSCSGVGGIFIPTLVMGSTLGNIFAKIINHLGFQISETNCTLIGMTGLMAGVLHAPLTAIFLIAEITGGYQLFTPLIIVATLSFAITKYFITHSIYTIQLAKKGQLFTHDKDQNVLMLLNIDRVIETNFIQLTPEMTLGATLKNAVAHSSRNHFPVVDGRGFLLGVLQLDHIRHLMFQQDLYEKVKVSDLMHSPSAVIHYKKDNVKTIMKKFQSTNAWSLPVVESNIYKGFISRSRLMTAYRTQLIQMSN